MDHPQGSVPGSTAVKDGRIDIDGFFRNPSYFGRDRRGRRYAFRGHHPTLVHWPLAAYDGGHDVLAALAAHRARLVELAGPKTISWIDETHWHATVFSPVHSSDSRVIARTVTDVLEPARQAVGVTRPYVVTLGQLSVSPTGGIVALGVAPPGLTELRATLQHLVPHGRSSRSVHITLGQVTRALSPARAQALLQYVEATGGGPPIGSLSIPFLTYASYIAPFLRMRIREIARLSMGEQ
jgi:hypothetical protein